jgi:hypothetical protein
LPALRREGYSIEEIRIEDARGHRSGGFKVRAFRHALHDRFVSILRSDLAGLIYQSLRGKVRTILPHITSRLSPTCDVQLCLLPCFGSSYTEVKGNGTWLHGRVGGTASTRGSSMHFADDGLRLE